MSLHQQEPQCSLMSILQTSFCGSRVITNQRYGKCGVFDMGKLLQKEKCQACSL